MNVSPLRSFFPTNVVKDANLYRQSLRELIQKLCLLGLWRGGFYEHGAFYGGTALRMLHGLDRWSENLDFSLLRANPAFSLATYLKHVSQELEAWGIAARVDVSDKKDSQIESAFIKAKTLKSLINLEIPPSELRNLHRDEISSVKFEIDPHPPCGFVSESRFILEPIPFSVRAMSLSDLFAGKMHAVLARGWLSRVKGRDWYDLIWFVSSGVKLNLTHLEARLKQSGHLQVATTLRPEFFRDILRERICKIDFTQARDDVMPFIPNPITLQSWCTELFLSLVEKIICA